MLQTFQFNKNITMYGNYIHFKDMHIFNNINDINISIADNFKDKINQRIHIFITTHQCIDILKSLIKICNKAKIFIHVPYHVKDIKKYLDIELEDFPNVKVFLERKGPSFSINEYTHGFYYKMMLDVIYNEDEVLMSINLHRTSFQSYFISHCKHGAIKTNLQKEYPELYRDEIIQNFKDETPKGILKSFKDDNDIWNYIMNNNEWK